LIGNSYVGKVKHFSFWNCDYPYGVVLFNATFTDNKGTPLSGLTVALCFTTGTDSVAVNQGYGYTDATGHVSGAIPINQTLTMKVFAGGCSTPIYTQIIGAFSADVTLPTIALDLSSLTVDLITLKGQITDCSGAPTSNSYLRYNAELTTGIAFDLGLLFADNQGNFSKTLMRTSCAGSAAIAKVNYYAIDIANLKESLVQSKPISIGINDLGVVTACNALQQYLILDDNTTTYSFVTINTTTSLNDIFVSAYGDSTLTGSSFFAFWIRSTSPTYTVGTVYDCNLNADIFLGGKLTVVNGATPLPLVFTQVANVKDEYFEGTFNNSPNPVVVTDSQGLTHVYKGSFRFKRNW
jgi:hypothetical protein